MAYLYLQNQNEKEFSYAEAFTVLQAVEGDTFTGDLSSLPPVDYHSGDVYVIRLKSRKDEDWKGDKRGWKHYGKHVSDGVKKVYYQVVVGRWDNYSTAFKRNVYTLVDPSNTARPGLILHYVGDDTLAGQRMKHGNAKHHERPFIPMVRSTREGIRAKVAEGARPQQAYEQSKQSVEAMVQGEQGDVDVMEAILGPRNLKSAQNIKYAEDKAKRLSLDDTYNLTLLYLTGFEKFIRYFHVAPGVIVVFGDDNAITLGNRLLAASSKDASLEQLMSYDTTFDLGDFYVSLLVMRNTELQGDPIFPVLFMLHQKRPEKVHDIFWRYFVMDLLHIEQYGQNLPIISDREKAIINAIRANADGNHVICHNHIKSDVKAWLRKRKAKQGDFRGYKDHVRRLLACESTESFDALYDDLRDVWSLAFVVYANKHLRHDMRTYAIAAVTNKYAAFTDKTPTNNISESVNKMVKQKNDWEELPVDGIVLAMYLMQQAMLHEFNRGYKDLGNYHCKEAVRSAPDLCLENVAFIPLQDIIQRVKNELHERDIPLQKRPGYSMSSMAIAELCVDNDLVSYERLSKTHIVRSPFADEYHVVKLGPAITCSCTHDNCYHRKAVELLTGADLVARKTRTAKLSDLTKSRRAEGKSGRRRPRQEDVVVSPAPDSAAASKKSKGPVFAQSTPQHSPASSAGIASPFNDMSRIETPACEIESYLGPMRRWGFTSDTDDTPQSDYTGDHSCLKPGAEISNFTLEDFTRKIVQDCSMENNICVIPGSAYEFLRIGQYESTVRHIHAHDGLNKDAVYVVMPVDQHRGEHWVAGVINFRNREAYVLDSLNYHRYAMEICESLARTIVLCHAVARAACNIDDWQFIYSTDCPKQENGFDCGLYAGVFYLCGILERTTTKVIESNLCRKWVYNVTTKHTYEAPEKAPIAEAALNSVLQKVKNADVSKIVVVHGPTEAKTKSLLEGFDRDWTYCNYRNNASVCPGLDSEHEQIFCVICRKWLHTHCARSTSTDATYFECNACRYPGETDKCDDADDSLSF